VHCRELWEAQGGNHLFQGCREEGVLENLASDVIKDEIKLWDPWCIPGACCIEKGIALQLDTAQDMYRLNETTNIN
jgi:hypothetical protein